MSFVPIIANPPPPSPRAQALGEEIRALVEAHCRDHPETTSVDVQQALRLAATSRTGTRMLNTAIILGLGLLTLGLLVFLFFARGG